MSENASNAKSKAHSATSCKYTDKPIIPQLFSVKSSDCLIFLQYSV